MKQVNAVWIVINPLNDKETKEIMELVDSFVDEVIEGIMRISPGKRGHTTASFEVNNRYYVFKCSYIRNEHSIDVGGHLITEMERDQWLDNINNEKKTSEFSKWVTKDV